MSDKKIFGLTGMSGAGKSTVCKSFEKAGFYIIDCDKLAREVVKKGKPCLNKIHRLFGENVITVEGELDRKAMGNIVFTDGDKLELLNDTIYPYITYKVIEMCRNTDKYFVLLDAPTLFESGIDFICDGVVSVVCNREKSVERIMIRDNISRESAENRLGSQHDIEYYKSRSNFCIENNSDIDALKSKAEDTARKIINGSY